MVTTRTRDPTCSLSGAVMRKGIRGPVRFLVRDGNRRAKSCCGSRLATSPRRTPDWMRAARMPILISLARHCLAAEPERPANGEAVVDADARSYRAGVEERLRRARAERAAAQVREAEQRKRRKVNSPPRGCDRFAGLRGSVRMQGREEGNPIDDGKRAD